MLLVVLRAVSFISLLPLFLGMGAGLAAVSILLLSPQATYELFMLVNNFLFFVWLLLPASYNSQVVERFEMARLFAYPIRFRSIVVGSTLISLLTMTGVWSALILGGEIVGLVWQQPFAFPLIRLGTLPTFAVLVLSGRIMEDLFDLVAGDRRLRALALAVLSFPFMILGFGQIFVQGVLQNYDQVAFLHNLPIDEFLTRLSAARSFSEFLEVLRPSRLLIWFPAGWATAGMASASAGAWARAVIFLLVSLAAVGLLLWLHAGITRRLMQGAALGLGVERVRSRGAWFAGRLPGPPAFWALMRKDWTYLWRSPGPRRMVFGGLMATLPTLILLWQPDISTVAGHAIVPLLVGLFITVMIGMMVNVGITANYFGIIDREGFGAIAASPVDRRLVLVAANTMVFLLTGAMYALVFVVIGAATRSWHVVPLGLCFVLCMQVSGSPLYTLAALIGPYRMQLKYTSGARQRGNMWGMLMWFVRLSMVVLLVLPYIFVKPVLFATVPLAILYSLGLYVLTLKPLALLLQRREYAILEAVTTES